MNNDFFSLFSAPLAGGRIEQILSAATEGLHVQPAQLQEKIFPFINASATDAQIMQHLMLSALQMTSLQEPDWKNVAGRLKMLDLYRLCRARGYIYNYPRTLAENTACGVYTSQVTDKYSAQEIAQAASFINPAFDMVYDYAGANLLIKRYLCEYNDKIVELPQDMFLTIALLTHQNEPPEERMALVKDTYEKLADRKISLGTPLLMNLRRPNGNLSSCFITVMDDSRDSIFYVIDQISAISKFGGGVGCNLSRVRCKGARIQGVKNASGGAGRHYIFMCAYFLKHRKQICSRSSQYI